MTRALLLLLLAVPDGDLEEASLEPIRALAAAPIPEPEPPAGLRAEEGTPRFERAKAIYADLLRRWEADEARRHREISERCSAWLDDYPEGKRRAEVLRLRGIARLHLADFAAARADLEASLAIEPHEGAREACIAACRALGDYRGALRQAPDDPDLLEEAGEVARAIQAAKVAGRAGLAVGWDRLGRPLPSHWRVPEGCRALLVVAGGALDPALRARLEREFPPPGLTVMDAGGGEIGLYLADQDGIVRAVNPRPDTWIHRIRRLTAPR
ncbi:MAG: hypothetical protein ACT4PV_12325 [Planctomycetaceae bacterium]